MYIGLLSGTSLDAIDVAVVEFTEGLPKIHATYEHKIPTHFKENCLAITTGSYQNINAVGELDYIAANLFAEAVLTILDKYNFSKSDIRAIGSHGQTIIHNPHSKCPFTLQIGDANIIAAKTGITTISDFRRCDMAVGGQGAPLAPAFHRYIFRNSKGDNIIVNIGGISNISIIPRAQEETTGFDTGPGSCLMNDWIEKTQNLSFDEDGNFARKGTCIHSLLEQFLQDDYIKAPNPKSTGREYFNLKWLNQFNLENYSACDVQRTLLEFTVQNILLGVNQSFIHNPTLYVCGGGAKNKLLMERLSEEYSGKVDTTDSFGVPGDWMEACLFAWLAKQRLEFMPSNLPSVTGAKKKISLGNIFETTI